jgi:hypothetical protein
MGYRGKVEERARARELRAQSWTLQEIAAELGVGKGSVSVWVRDVEFDPRPRNRGHPAGPKHPMRVKKEQQIERCRQEAERGAASLTLDQFFVWGIALYHGEGAKTERSTLSFANTSGTIIAGYVRWLRTFFDIDEQRLRARLYLHVGLDEAAAMAYWSDLTAIPLTQFGKTYRAELRGEFKQTKHVFGCLTVRYADRELQRRVIAHCLAIASAFANPG